MDGKTNAEIAAELHIEINSVKHRLTGAYMRLNATNIAQAVAIAMRKGIVE